MKLKNYKIYTTILVCCISLQSGCDDPSSTGNEDVDLCASQSGDVLVPLAEGNYWRWEITYPWFQLTYPDTSIVRDTAYTEVERMISADVEGVELCFGEMSFTRDGVSSSFYIWNGEDGPYFLHHEDSGDTTVLVIDSLARWNKYPAEIGDEWIVSDNTIELIARDVVLITPAGTFNCLVYYARPTDPGQYHWFTFYAPGIGEIVRESYTVPYSIPEMELPEYYDFATRNPAHMTRLMTLIDYQVK